MSVCACVCVFDWMGFAYSDDVRGRELFGVGSRSACVRICFRVVDASCGSIHLCGIDNRRDLTHPYLAGRRHIWYRKLSRNRTMVHVHTAAGIVVSLDHPNNDCNDHRGLSISLVCRMAERNGAQHGLSLNAVPRHGTVSHAQYTLVGARWPGNVVSVFA